MFWFVSINRSKYCKYVLKDYRLPRSRSSVVLNKPKEEDLFVHKSVSYEPENSAQIDWLLGFKHRSDTGLNLLACSTQKNNPNLKKYENKFHVDAKEGIEYWPRLKRPQVVKTKGNCYNSSLKLNWLYFWLNFIWNPQLRMYRKLINARKEVSTR